MTNELVSWIVQFQYKVRIFSAHSFKIQRSYTLVGRILSVERSYTSPEMTVYCLQNHRILLAMIVYSTFDPIFLITKDCFQSTFLVSNLFLYFQSTMFPKFASNLTITMFPIYMEPPIVFQVYLVFWYFTRSDQKTVNSGECRFPLPFFRNRQNFIFPKIKLFWTVPLQVRPDLYLERNRLSNPYLYYSRRSIGTNRKSISKYHLVLHVRNTNNPTKNSRDDWIGPNFDIEWAITGRPVTRL